MVKATAFILLRWKRRANLIVTRSRMPKAPLPHQLVALWFADIAGYSDRAAEDERGALQLIEILQSLSRDTVRRYGRSSSQIHGRCGPRGIPQHRTGRARSNRIERRGLRRRPLW